MSEETQIIRKALAALDEEEREVLRDSLQPQLLREVEDLPPVIEFKYYLHDDRSTSERQEVIEDQTGFAISDELMEKMGRPFYEVELQCELDTATGAVTIKSVK